MIEAVVGVVEKVSKLAAKAAELKQEAESFDSRIPVESGEKAPASAGFNPDKRLDSQTGAEPKELRGYDPDKRIEVPEDPERGSQHENHGEQANEDKDTSDQEKSGFHTLEKDGFVFTIDKQGRTAAAEGQLTITHNEKQRNMPGMDAVGKGDQRESDQQGHLVGRRFGAPDSVDNVVAQDAACNRDFAKLETELAKAVDAGHNVFAKVEPQYEGNSNRPSGFTYTYTIDGEKSVVVFKNGGDK